MSAFGGSQTRRPVYAPHGMVATSQPLATSVGLFILKDGGTAADAAIAMAAALTVVEPTSCGIGSDLMAIIASPQGIDGCIGSGRAPTGLDAAHVASAISPRGWHTVTVPAAPRTWADIHKRHGRLPFQRLLAPAIHYARNGFPLSPVIAEQWQRGAQIHTSLHGDIFAPFAETFLPNDFEPRAGAYFANPDLAMTLERIARSRADEMYTGTLAKHIIRYSENTGGTLRAEDLAGHTTEWHAPASVAFREQRVFELPPPTQGAVALIALGLLDALGSPPPAEEAEHVTIEAIKHAFAVSLPVIADGDEARAWLHAMLKPSTLADEARAIGATAAVGPRDARLDAGTVYLAAADTNGMMVSLIQSSFMDFGSYLVVPGTGIAFTNRAWCFTREKGHPNAPHPGRRPYNTIIPGMLADGKGKAVGPFGVMGGYMQPQGHVQILRRLLDDGLDPQRALDAPRWRFVGERAIACEPEWSSETETALARRGHRLHREATHSAFGRGQIILHTAGGWVAGSDNRADGCAIGY